MTTQSAPRTTQVASRRATRTPLEKTDPNKPLMTLADVAAQPAAASAVNGNGTTAEMRSGTASQQYYDPELAELLSKGREGYIPFGAMQQSMKMEEKPGWHYHWFNETPGRIRKATEAGYQHCLDDDGKPVSMVVGVREGGGDLTAYRMRIPQEWFEADQRPVQQHLDAIEDGMRRGTAGRPDQTRYVPAWQPIKIGTKVHGPSGVG